MNKQHTEQPELEHRERKRFGAGCVAVAFVMLLVLYLLSPPIALKLASHWGGVGEAFIKSFYAPIIFSIEKLPIVEAFYSWYFSLFPDSWPR
jgi:hypothetical protein